MRLSAQVNLVPNPSFEDTIGCPIGNGDIDSVKNWFNPAPNASTPDFFHSCSYTYGVPYNPFLGFQSARTGIAYSGFTCYSNIPDPSNPAYKNYREYIGVKLLEPLKARHNYQIEFYINASNKQEYSVANIGVFVCSGYMLSGFTNQELISVLPQFETPDYFFVTDTLGWTKISGTITASGDEDYLIIGNFRDSSILNVQYLGDHGSYFDIPANDIDSANYFAIDDVSLIDVTPQIHAPNVFTPNGDNVNDYFILKDTLIANYTCYVFDRWGASVTNFQRNERGWNGKSQTGNECSNGVYFYLVIAEGLDEKEYQIKGFVQLLR